MTDLLGALTLLGVGLVALSCTVTPAAEECERACAVASRCGLLPSALGGAVDEPSAHNELSCVTRCIASQADDPQVTGLLARLAEAGELPDDALCTLEGTHTCKDLLEVLEHEPDTSELEVTTTLTVRMINLVSHVTTDSLGSWCCFDHRYDLDGVGDGDELANAYEVLASTYECIDALRSELALAGDPEASYDPCPTITELWRERMPDDTTSPCVYARQSTRLGAIGIPGTPEACAELDAMGFGGLAEQLDGLTMSWHIEHGGILVDTDGDFRELEDVRALLQEELHTKLAHPGAPLESACRELIGTTDTSGCDTLDREALAEPVACEGGPACNRADCLEESPACDTTLCDAERSPPGRDCGELGVTEVRLGYRNAQGLEVLGDPIDGCEALTEVSTTFERVKVGPLAPVAVVSGSLPTFLSHDATSHPFSWIVIGDAQWVTAGVGELEVHSPLVEWAEQGLENPLEALGWVARRLPTGKPCDLEPAQCEGYFNNNCDNGVDDDDDGLVDDDSAWCDELLRTLVAKCVLSEPGREPPEGCRADGPAP